MPVTVEKLCKSYGDRAVLKNLSFAFPEGEITCLLGPSGSGKTTLLNLLSGLTAPDSGAIRGLEGRRISRVFQENRLLENLGAVKNVLLTAQAGFTRADAQSLLHNLGLPIDALPVSRYSGGMQRRVAIARALAADFDLLLLDEPLSGLDSAARALVRECIFRHCAGKTCIWVTHYPQELPAGGSILRLD